MSSCFSRCLRVPIAMRRFYEQSLWIPQKFLFTNLDLHHGLLGDCKHGVDCSVEQLHVSVRRLLRGVGSFSKGPTAKTHWRHALRVNLDLIQARAGNETQLSPATCWPDPIQNGAPHIRRKEWHGPEKKQ